MLEDLPTLDIIHELQRRFAVLNRPEKSVLISDSPALPIAEAMKKHFGSCVIGPADDSPLPTRLLKISSVLSTPQCRRGFAIFGLNSKEELEGFDRMLAQDHPTKKSYSVVGWNGVTNFHGKPVLGIDKEKELTGQLERLLIE